MASARPLFQLSLSCRIMGQFCPYIMHLKSPFLSRGFFMCGILNFCTKGKVNDCRDPTASRLANWPARTRAGSSSCPSHHCRKPPRRPLPKNAAVAADIIWHLLLTHLRRQLCIAAVETMLVCAGAKEQCWVFTATTPKPLLDHRVDELAASLNLRGRASFRESS